MTRKAIESIQAPAVCRKCGELLPPHSVEATRTRPELRRTVNGKTWVGLKYRNITCTACRQLNAVCSPLKIV